MTNYVITKNLCSYSTLKFNQILKFVLLIYIRLLLYVNHS